MLNLEERRWVLSMLHACPNTRYLTTEAGREELFLALQSHVRYQIDRQTQTGLVDPVPQNAFGDWVRNIFRTCPVPIVSGVLHQSVIAYARTIIESPLFLVLRSPETLTSMLGLLSTRDFVALTMVHPLANQYIRQQYDPFQGSRGRVMLGNVGRTLPGGGLQTLLTQLARHAFNYVYDQIPNPGVDHARTTDTELTEWSGSSQYGSSGRSFLATNCVATTQINGGEVNSVNFISYGNTDKTRLVQNLNLDTRDYDPITHMHGEIRLVEKQDDAYENNPLFVDKLCCPFCTVQLLAMGRLSQTRGSTRTSLQWYSFTPYVVYFRYRRMHIWGAEVEAIFNRLKPDTKALFLQILATVCRTTKYNTTDLGCPLDELREYLNDL